MLFYEGYLVIVHSMMVLESLRKERKKEGMKERKKRERKNIRQFGELSICAS